MSDKPNNAMLAEYMRSLTQERDALTNRNAHLLRSAGQRLKPSLSNASIGASTDLGDDPEGKAQMQVGVLLRAIAAVCNVNNEINQVEAYDNLSLFKWTTDTLQATIRCERAEARNQQVRGVSAMIDEEEPERKRRCLMSRLEGIVRMSNEAHAELLADDSNRGVPHHSAL